MDLLKLLYFLTLVSTGVIAKHADLEVYWKSKLPNSPMPKAVRDIVRKGKPPGGASFTPEKPPIALYKYTSPTEAQLALAQLHYHPKITAFFLEKDLHRGSSVNMQFIESVNDNPAFLPRQVADSTPFSSKSVPEILNKFSVNPHSAQAEAIKKTIAECEEPAIEGEDKYCATSLESMVDFTTSKLGKNVLAFSNEAPKNAGKIQKYGIVDVSKLNNDKAIVDDELAICHKQNYVYAVFYCHSFQNIDAYMVNLVGADGAKVKAVVVCHKDTSSWDPRHLVFQLLKVKPGTVPICHFLPGDHIVWVPKH